MSELGIEIMLDKPRHLVLNLNVVKDFEQATNKNFWHMDGAMTGTDTLALLWASLNQEIKPPDKPLTQREVGEMADGSKWAEIDKKIAELLAQLKPKEKKGKAPPLAKDRT